MISTEYQNSENCEKELSYADTLKKNVIPVLLEPNFRPSGWLALVIAREDTALKSLIFGKNRKKIKANTGDLFLFYG